jgi:hypothetical protein
MKIARLLLAAFFATTVSIADDTNGPPMKRIPFPPADPLIDSIKHGFPAGIRPSADGKSFDYICRLMSVAASDSPDQKFFYFNTVFRVEEGDAKGCEIDLLISPGRSENDQRVQDLASQFVSRTSTNTRVELTFGGELVGGRAALSTRDKLFKSCQVLNVTSNGASAQQPVPANIAPPSH